MDQMSSTPDSVSGYINAVILLGCAVMLYLIIRRFLNHVAPK